jgi:phosphatidylinositol-3,4,5-trisphosphate 5-phosphatase 2
VRQTDEHGLYLMLIAKAEVQTRIYDVAMSKVKLLVHNTTGNKGSIMVRFGFEDTTFVFMNCHLAGGTTARNVDERHEQIV